MAGVLIAESGATKTEWLLEKGSGSRRHAGLGLNPSQVGEAELRLRLREAAEALGEVPGSLYFFGAGSGQAAQAALLRRLLGEAFPGAAVEIGTDLEAALLAAGREEGIVSILGTGSNCCQYRGREIVAQAGGHGYLLGDEGSGADLGRALLRALLMGDLPAALAARLCEAEGATPLELRTRVYRAPQPGLQLAALSRHLAAWQEEPFVRELLAGRFVEFIGLYLLRLPGAGLLPCDFVGSVAAHYAGPLAEACARHALQMGLVIAQPAEALAERLASEMENRLHNR
jgi:hypothetical protein